MTLRTKLTIGFLPLLAILIGLGLWAIVMFYGLGGSIDVILRENYRSVLAVERMKEALERMDSGFMFAISGRDEKARTQFDKSKAEFEKHLEIEQSNITIQGEQELVDELTAEYGNYVKLAAAFFDLHSATAAERSEFYFSRLLPTFEKIKRLEDAVLDMNQRNMELMNREGPSRLVKLPSSDDCGAPGRGGSGHRLGRGSDAADLRADRRRDARGSRSVRRQS